MILRIKPSKVQIYVAKCTKTAAQVKSLTGCDVVINGGLYSTSNKAVCHLKVDGQILASDQYKYWGYGWNTVSLDLVNEYSAFDNYIACVCMVKDGTPLKMYYNADVGGSRQRTALGRFSDGSLWVYAVQSPTATPEQLQKIAVDAGVTDALMLDGGGSTQGIRESEVVSSTRKVHNYICIWGEETMSNSKLATYTKISPNKTSPRNHAIDTITIHCTAGNKNNTATQIANLTTFTSSSGNASCNYAVGGDGSIALIVDEKDRSWCSSNSTNDHRAITIEIASNTTGTEVTDKAYNALINLVADICKRNGIKKLVWSTNKNDRVNHLNGCNMTVHRDYANKACPGEYLYSRHGDIANKVNAKLGVATTNQVTTSSSYTVKITASMLNVRKGAGTSYAVTAVVKKNEVYTIVEEENGWGKLKSGAGWIKLSYTTKC